jgi:hypothetical protein
MELCQIDTWMHGIVIRLEASDAEEVWAVDDFGDRKLGGQSIKFHFSL